MNDKALDHAVASRLLNTFDSIWRAKCAKLVEEADKAEQALDVIVDLNSDERWKACAEWERACDERDAMIDSLKALEWKALADLRSSQVDAELNASREEEGKKE